MIFNPTRWTLRSKLLASIVTLFVVVIALIGMATVITTQRSLMGQIDSQLSDTQRRLGGPGDGSSGGIERHGPGVPLGGNQLKVTMTAASTCTSFLTTENYVTSAGGTTTALNGTQLNKLMCGSLGTRPMSVHLGGSIGEYRVVAFQRPSGSVTVVGLPLEPIDDNIHALARNIALMGLLGLIAVGGASYLLVQRNLRPLRRVAATAERVSELPLSEGTARTDERVPHTEIDARTEVGTVGLALNNLLDHVDSALESRHQSEMQVRQFVADASHELRTPLASIRGYAELSKREREPVPANVTHALGRIESEADRMTALVEDLLLLARLDAGRELERSPVDLTRIAVETVSDLHAAGPDHVWHLDLPEDIEDFPEVIGDEARLRQVLINLLANARRHTPAGTVVTTGLQRDGDRVLLTVTDDGPGIPEEFMPHLFERFTRGDTARTRTEGSTGLGLSIVDAVVSAHHGFVRVDSEPGFTRFTVSLPMASTGGADDGTIPRTGATPTMAS